MRNEPSLTRKLTVVAGLAVALAVAHWAIGPSDAMSIAWASGEAAANPYLANGAVAGLAGDVLADRNDSAVAAERANDASDPVEQPANERHDQNDQHQQWDDLPPIGQGVAPGRLVYADARAGG